ncbi:MAG: hypothetical protein M3505_12820 [Verrucomicrobiota bacterium]|nr:hypothetical protein [Verrucomicrobiota bacterium]
MRTFLRTLAVLMTLGFSSMAFAAGDRPMDVVVMNATGNVAFKGKTAGNGTFATGKLEPGNYVVQLNSKDASVKGAQYMVVVSAGKKKISADAVAGEKLMAGGVALKVDVAAPATNITGQITSGNVVGANAGSAAKGNGKVKIINGKRYVWQGAETGSHIGGRWVEEGTASNVRKGGAEALSGMQDKGSQGQAVSGGQ